MRKVSKPLFQNTKPFGLNGKMVDDEIEIQIENDLSKRERDRKSVKKGTMELTLTWVWLDSAFGPRHTLPKWILVVDRL